MKWSEQHLWTVERGKPLVVTINENAESSPSTMAALIELKLSFKFLSVSKKKFINFVFLKAIKHLPKACTYTTYKAYYY